MSTHVLLTGLAIFFARICDVSLGTIRTIATVQGRTKAAFVLGFFEISIWITVVSAVVHKIATAPILGLFYALGYATGNAVGIMVERKMAFGFLVLRVFTRTAGKEMADRLREHGQRVTIFLGEGMRGPVTELYVVTRRRDLKWILQIIMEEDPEAFYTTEYARDVGKVLRPTLQPSTGWRAITKKK
ncbi:MAG: DUF5698 domain-containing protein [Pseudomonadota bacterium]